MFFSDFLIQISGSYSLLIAVLLTTGVIVVNGWTDAPTAIATCISTGAIKEKSAILMAAIMNFSGVYIMSRLNGKVAASIYNIADFGTDISKSFTALCAAMLSIIIWSVAAWYFGIPTSESHALTAGLTGAAASLNKSLKNISRREWLKVLIGLIISTIPGFLFGYIIEKLILRFSKKRERKKNNIIFSYLQKFSAAFMAFMHGAQDGQKFIGVFLIATSLASKKTETDFSPPFWLILFCSIAMAAGTSMGGMRIIKKIGSDMVQLDKGQGFSADLAGIICLMVATLTGIPVSTTHTKTTAIMGAGAAKDSSGINIKIVKEMFTAWILTFPGCGFLGYCTSEILLRIL